MKSFPEHCPSQESSPNSNRQQDKQLEFHELSLFVWQAVWVIRPNPNQMRVMPLHLYISFEQLGHLSVSSVFVKCAISTCLQLPAGLLSGKPSSNWRAAMPNKTINPVSVQKFANFVILLAMSPVLLVLVVVSTTYLLSVLVAISGILG